MKQKIFEYEGKKYAFVSDNAHRLPRMDRWTDGVLYYLKMAIIAASVVYLASTFLMLL